MISKCATKITDLCIRKMIIECTEKEIYQYGFELIISTAVNIFWIFLIGCLFRSVFLSLLAFVFFAWIRTQSGGYHASSYLRCNFSLILVFSFIMSMVQFFKITDLNFAFFVLAYIYVPLFMWQFSPIKNLESPLSDTEYVHIRNKILIRVIICEAVGICGWIFGYDELTVMILFVLIAIIILIIIEKLKRRRLDENQY